MRRTKIIMLAVLAIIMLVAAFGSVLAYSYTPSKCPGHTYGAWKTSKSATCTAKGIRYKICTRCGTRQYGYTSALGHNFKGTKGKYSSWKKVSTATYCRLRTYKIKCTRCSTYSSANYNEYDKTHNYESWTTTKAATCTATGSRARTCKDCGYKQTETLKKLSHVASTTYGKDSSSHWTKCKNCAAQMGVKSSHSYESAVVSKAATCESTGSRYYICKTCGYKKDEVIPKTQHNYNYTPYGDGATLHGAHCTICNLFSSQAHQWKNGKCSICNYSCKHPQRKYTSNGASNHTITCTKCGIVITQSQGHTFSYSPIGTTNRHTVKCLSCNYEGTEAHIDSNKDGKCDKCKATVAVAHTHNYKVTATTYKNIGGANNKDGMHMPVYTKVCQNSGCSNKTITENGTIEKHRWVELTRKAASVSSTGKITYRCQSTGCGATYEVIIPKLTSSATKTLSITGDTSVYVGESISLGTSPSATVTWRLQQGGSGQGKLASTTGTGNKFTGTSVGTVVVTAEATGYTTATKIITVKEKTTKKAANLTGGTSITLHVGESKNVNFSFANPNGKLNVVFNNGNSAGASTSVSGKTVKVIGKIANTTTVYTVTVTGNDEYLAGTTRLEVKVIPKEATTPTGGTPISHDYGDHDDDDYNPPIKLTGIKVEPEEKTIKVGEEFGITVTFIPSNATNQKVTYTSSDPNVAYVSAEGNVIGVNPGKAVITIKTADGGYTATCKVTVLNVDGIIAIISAKYDGNELLPDNQINEVPTGEPIELSATIPNGEVTSMKYFWDGDTPTEFDGSLQSIIVPTDFEPGSTHILTVQAFVNDEQVGEQIYIIRIPTGNEVATVDAIAKYHDEELAKLQENPTELPVASMIEISAVSNPAGIVTSIIYTWEDGTQGRMDGASGMIQVPSTFVAGDTYSLSLQPYVGETPYAIKQYHIRIPAGFQINAKLNEEEIPDGFKGTGNIGDPIILYAEPESEVVSISYIWDNKASNDWVVDNNTAVALEIPYTFNPGETHILYAYAIGNNGKVSNVKTYTFVIPNPNSSENPLEVLPWEEENFELEQLGIMLRNDSESSKSNKNMYALNEDATYFIDFKNGGDDIKGEVTIKFNIPLEFEVIDNDGGQVDEVAKTIIWTYPNGMEKGYSGTKKVVLRYIALSNNHLEAETIYPLAKILVGRQIKDDSAVINYIYRDSDTLITAVHAPYMYGDANATTFRPDDTITRAEGALVLVRILLGQDVINNTQVSFAYPDINETYLEAQKAITAATEYGIINGYTDGTYRPNRIMTRAEFMKILASYIEINASRNNIQGLQIKGINEAVKLYNNPVSEYIVNGQIVTNHWAIEEISLLTRLNMTPVNIFETDLRIDKGITRAEVAQLVNFHLLRAPVEVMYNIYTGFSDVSIEHTLIGDILEATRALHNFKITSDGKEN